MKARALLLLLTPLAALAQDGFQFNPGGGPLHLAIRPSVEALYWTGDHPAPATVDIPDDTFFAPRLTVEFDAAYGEHLFFHTTARWDRGFDGGNRRDGEVRVDELFLRVRPGGDERLSLQAGKYPTVFGAWVAQHDFYDDPFLLPPLPYSQIIGIQERVPAALSPAAIAARARGTAAPLSSLSKQNWASPLWGPVYATGFAAFGSAERFDYAVEVKSSGLSSHSDQWDNDAGDFSAPTFTARAGYRPDAAWAFGFSASRGSYLAEQAEPRLPASMDRSDLSQTTLGLDVRWAHRDWIVTGEVIASEYETLAAGDLRTLAWFAGVRYKAAPGVWLGARFGQLFANEVTAPDGASVPWTSDVWRAEFAAGWHLTPHTLVKADYSYTHSQNDSAAGEHLLGLALGLRW